MAVNFGHLIDLFTHIQCCPLLWNGLKLVVSHQPISGFQFPGNRGLLKTPQSFYPCSLSPDFCNAFTSSPAYWSHLLSILFLSLISSFSFSGYSTLLSSMVNSLNSEWHYLLCLYFLLLHDGWWVWDTKCFSPWSNFQLSFTFIFSLLWGY